MSLRSEIWLDAYKTHKMLIIIVVIVGQVKNMTMIRVAKKNKKLRQQLIILFLFILLHNANCLL